MTYRLVPRVPPHEPRRMKRPLNPTVWNTTDMIDAVTALKRLREGNQRFAAGLRSPDTLLSHTKRAELTAGQEPFAVILGCSDSRVPAEIVFDQGLGDLFVIRVAGNIVAPSQVGSVEFAVCSSVRGWWSCWVIPSAVQCAPRSSSYSARPVISRVTSVPLSTVSAPPWRGCWRRSCVIIPRR